MARRSVRPGVLILAAALGLLVVTGLYLLGPRSRKHKPTELKPTPSGVVNILIIGKDARAVGPVKNEGRQRNRREKQSHSDIVVVCHIDFGRRDTTENGDCTARRALRGTVPGFRPSVSLVAVPRDLLVEVPGITAASSNTDFTHMEKITHTYAIGGDRLLRRAIEHLLGIKIHRSITFDFDSFRMTFDLLRPFVGALRVGGVTLSERNQALRFARRRQGLKFDDTDRCRNAVSFIRGIIVRTWWLTNTRLGDMLVRRMLAIVGPDTDLTNDEVHQAADGLRQAGFSPAWTKTAVLVGTGADVTLARYRQTMSCFLPVYREIEKQIDRFLLDKKDVAALDFMTQEPFRVPGYADSNYVLPADTQPPAPPLPFDTSVPDSQVGTARPKELSPPHTRREIPNAKPQAPDTGDGPTRK